MNIQPVFTRYDINRKIPFDRSSPIVVDHVEDFDTRFIEVYVYESIYNKQVDLKGTTITARIVAAPSTEKILLNDNVACTLNGSGNIIIPIDGKVIETLASTLLIEVRITQDDQALVLPFPLYVQMRGSILDDAGIAPESRGTIPELLEAAIAALEEAKNYENLENKPQINGHTLSGNKTSDDLGLQKKLTAGQNITIANDGTISADGGVTSYNDLENIPAIKTGEGDFVGTSLVDLPIKGTIHFDRDFFYYNSRFGKICLSDRVFKENNAVADYDFNDIPEVLFTSGWQIFDTSEIINLPQFLHSYSTIAIIQLCTPNATEHFIRGVLTLDNNQSKPRLFLQTATADFSMWWLESYPIINQSEWVEVGGSQIVSGVVNQNGTITFTDSDGNTFTTTGSSVIGADGFSPVATVTPTASGATVSITDKNGTTTANISNGAPGQDYVLTEQDKSDIADIVLGELPTTEGVLYGN